MSDLLGNHIVGFPMRRLIYWLCISGSKLDATISSSQKSQFQDFLLRANKYNTLDIFGDSGSSKKIVFVEVSSLTFCENSF